MLGYVVATLMVVGLVLVAISGYRFIDEEDERRERIARQQSPALWGEATADEVLIR
jgi:hypothetical protein